MVSRAINIHDSEEYKYVYEAMKKSRLEISDSIDNQKLIIFESNPMNFKDPHS